MTRRITVLAVYADLPERLFARACDMADLASAMSGMARYSGLPDRAIVAGDVFEVDAMMWGWLPLPRHTVRIDAVDPGEWMVQSYEQNDWSRHWSHRLTLSDHPRGALWRDEVVITADRHEWTMATFCSYFYRHRHRARKALQITSEIERI